MIPHLFIASPALCLFLVRTAVVSSVILFVAWLGVTRCARSAAIRHGLRQSSAAASHRCSSPCYPLPFSSFHPPRRKRRVRPPSYQPRNHSRYQTPLRDSSGCPRKPGPPRPLLSSRSLRRSRPRGRPMRSSRPAIRRTSRRRSIRRKLRVRPLRPARLLLGIGWPLGGIASRRAGDGRSSACGSSSWSDSWRASAWR